MNKAYRRLNILLHFLHLGIIFFLVFGWIFPGTRPLHLAFVVLTLGSWIQFGYCPLTRLQWRVRRAAGLPRASGPYIPYLARQLSHRHVNAKRMDRWVTAATILIALLSLGINVSGFLKS